MPSECVVNLDDILTIPKTLLTERLTMLSEEKLGFVAKAIVFALDLKL
jgi:mRNA-degrading endonuclease toxin of MazEF toxin-antitoxin module